jgi:hypothetical protein
MENVLRQLTRLEERLRRRAVEATKEKVPELSKVGVGPGRVTAVQRPTKEEPLTIETRRAGKPETLELEEIRSTVNFRQMQKDLQRKMQRNVSIAQRGLQDFEELQRDMAEGLAPRQAMKRMRAIRRKTAGAWERIESDLEIPPEYQKQIGDLRRSLTQRSRAIEEEIKVHESRGEIVRREKENTQRLERDRRELQRNRQARERSRKMWLGDIEQAQKGVLEDLTPRERRRYTLTAEEQLEHRRDRRRRAEERLERMRETRMERRRERGQAMSGATMGMASAGIGLFGMAGFPLLNIAFASMSGMRYAGIAAVATGIGELSRAIARLQDEAMQAALSIDSVSDEYKEQRGALEATKGFFGGIMREVEARALRERAERQYRADTPKEMITTMERELTRAIARQNIGSWWFNPARMFGDPRREAREMVARGTLTNTLDEMITNATEKLRPFRAAWGDPGDIYKNIQTAISSRVSDERRHRIEQLRLLKDLRDRATEALDLYKMDTEKLDELRARETVEYYRGYGF